MCSFTPDFDLDGSQDALGITLITNTTVRSLVILACSKLLSGLGSVLEASREYPDWVIGICELYVILKLVIDCNCFPFA